MARHAPVKSLKHSANPRLAPSHEEIAVEAEVLWRQRGCPRDCDTQIWLEAERTLRVAAKHERHRRDTIALSKPLSRLNLKSDDVMGELEELCPDPKASVTTAL